MQNIFEGVVCNWKCSCPFW